MTARILIIGAGGHAQVIADCLLRMAEAGNRCWPIGFVDDNPVLHGQEIFGLPVFGSITTIPTIPHDALLLGIGNNKIRCQLFMALAQQDEQFATAIHPRATVAPDVSIGPGALICAGAIINTGSTIGANVIVNTGATVDHGNTIGAHAHIAPGVHLGGDVFVGEGTLIGIGTTVMPQRMVGKWAVVGAASLVHAAVDDYTTAFGIPAREKEARSHSN